MKKVINLFAIVSLILIGFTSCEKEETPGGIPGMGETPGKLEIKEAFVAPEDVNISVQAADEITLEDLINSSETSLKSTSSRPWYCGAGGSFWQNNFTFWIRIRLTLTNAGDNKKCVKFPAGLIFKVQQEGYQNGILLHCVRVCIPANSTKEVEMFAFCLNKGRDGSNANLTYTMPGVTGSNVLWKWMLHKLERKKINIENFFNPSPSAKLKSVSEEDLEYFANIADQLQNAVWTLTNDGKELSQEQVDFIDSLPDEE
jgi:hypothetical protein